ncbi:MAG: DUF2950 domain-containing protein [Burkholderiales bacterium]
MKNTTMSFTRFALAGILAAGLALALPATAQTAYPTPEAAADHLADGLARHDWDQVKATLGPQYRKLVPEGSVTKEDVTNFLAGWAKGHSIVTKGPDKAQLQLANGWVLPVPIIKTAKGWSFDTVGAAEEMRIRRIGRNELAAIQGMYAYIDAQREYAQVDHNGDGVLEYAQKILSTPGKQDGLFWATKDGEAVSPLGPLLDTEKLEDGYHGYRFKILKAQGKNAKGGARDYVLKGRMTNGFGLVAWPAKYGDTGVMTFIVNHDGVAYEKDLGPNGAAIAKAMTRFDPDSTWKALPTPQ